MHTLLDPGIATQSMAQVEQVVDYLALLDGTRVRNLLFMGMTMITGYDLRRQKKRRDIVGAAKELFIQHGIDRVTVDEIATAARVSKVTIYNHFGSRENLIQEIVLDIIEDENERLRYIADSDITSDQKIESMMAVKIENHQAGNRALIMDAAARDAELKLKMEKAVQEGKQWLHAIYEQALASRNAEQKVKAETFYAYMEMMAAFACTAGLVEGGKPTEELKALFWNGILGGMAQPARAGGGMPSAIGERMKLLR